MTEIRLPFPVSVNDMYGNNKGAGRGRFVMPEYAQWRADATICLYQQQVRPILGRVVVHIDLDDTRQGDCDNRIKPILDLLVKEGTLGGDSKKYVKRVSIGWESIEGCRIALETA